MIRFPTALRKMWSGGEVQEWLDSNQELQTALSVQTNADQVALDTSTEIMKLVYGPMPIGGSVQLQARIQCLIADAICGGSK